MNSFFFHSCQNARNWFMGTSHLSQKVAPWPELSDVILCLYFLCSDFVCFRWAWQSMWAYFCWLQKSWVCRLILKTMPSCPGLTPMLHSTIGLTAGSAEHSPLHQWKMSHGGHLHFKERAFSKSANTFNNHMWCLFLNWWHLRTLRWTDVTMDIMWLFILILTWFNDYFALHL